ncbi:GntR family transcriptional regulator, partial [Streptomyces griseoflavus]|uniref:GntR family transcriptional regulator n=1 Tax=Streptomyces griseoflavus TaxID=35619 RepID=UPI0001B4B6A7
MKQGTRGSAATDEAVTGRAATGRLRVPEQPAAGEAARGEHTHGEHAGRGEYGLPWPRAVVRRSSVRGQILDALRTALVTGDLRPGEVYSAPVLGERFGVSATPVREAMQQLTLE